jgi:hypothetical protein
MTPRFTFYLAIVIFVFSCGENEPVAKLAVGNYMPLQIGFSQIYAVTVDSIGFSFDHPVTRDLFELKTTIIRSFLNADSSKTYVMDRSMRPDENSTWKPFGRWTIRINADEMLVTEGNTSFVKLTYPVIENKTWNGNKYNAKNPENYRMVNVNAAGLVISDGLPFAANGFQKTLKVIQKNSEDFFLFYDKRTEVYAQDVGLIQKEIIQLNYCTTDNCYGLQKISKGVIWRQTIKRYGVL